MVSLFYVAFRSSRETVLRLIEGIVLFKAQYSCTMSIGSVWMASRAPPDCALYPKH